MDLEVLNTILVLEETLITFARQSVVMVSLALALLAFFFVERHASVMTTPISIIVMVLAFILILSALIILIVALRNFQARVRYLPSDARGRETKRSRVIVVSFFVTLAVLVGFALLLAYMGINKLATKTASGGEAA